MWELAWFTLGALKGWRRIGYKVNIWQNLVNDLIVVLYCLQSPNHCWLPEGPQVWPSSYTQQRHKPVPWRDPLTLYVRVCVFRECVHRHSPSFLIPSQNTAETQHSNYFYGFFFSVCPQGSFSQFNCLRGLFPCGILFQNVPVKISFWGGRKERVELKEKFLKHADPQSHKNSPNCVSWN